MKKTTKRKAVSKRRKKLPETVFVCIDGDNSIDTAWTTREAATSYAADMNESPFYEDLPPLRVATYARKNGARR